LIFNGIHDDISQKTELFITVVRLYPNFRDITVRDSKGKIRKKGKTKERNSGRRKRRNIKIKQIKIKVKGCGRAHK
jgi:hypothetical protein